MQPCLLFFLWSEHDDLAHHKRRYNKKGLLKAFKKSKLEVGFIGYFNFWLFPMIYIVRKMNNILGKKGRSDVSMPKVRIINKILQKIFASEKFLLDKIRLPFGVSLMVQAKK